MTGKDDDAEEHAPEMTPVTSETSDKARIAFSLRVSCRLLIGHVQPRIFYLRHFFHFTLRCALQ